MIIKHNSFLRKPSKKIDTKQIVAINAIRYSVDIIEMAFNRLKSNLFEFQDNYHDGKYISLIFSDIWVIIINGAILKNIIIKNFNRQHNIEDFGVLNMLKGLRDTNQHLEERSFQVWDFPDLPPVYGTVSWYAKKKENDAKGTLTTIYSGTIFRDIEMYPENPVGKINTKTVNDIKFEGIERVKRTNNFIKSTIYINHIIRDMTLLVLNFEKKFEEQFKDIDLNEKYISDLIIQMDLEESDSKTI